jgi:hypothetical protein
MNKIEEIEGRFQSITCNMIDYDYNFYPDIIINTSCEHIDQHTYDIWLSKIPFGSLVVLQSNNYFDLDEHIRCAEDIDHFISQSNLTVFSSAILELSKYKRFMIIGNKK